MPSGKFEAKQHKISRVAPMGSKVLKKKVTQSPANGEESSICTTNYFSEECSVCHRTFRSKEHFSKHRRGALCRRLVQKVARKHRKLASKSKSFNGMQENIHKMPKKKANRNAQATHVFKPYQCNICSAKFYDKVNVELHLEREHSTSQQLWTELTPVKLDGRERIEEPGSNIQYSSPNTFVDGNINCIDMNNGQYYSRFKCMECNLQFTTINELSEHQRLNHSSSMELNSLQNDNLCHSRSMNSYITDPVPNNCHTNNSINLTIQNKGMSLNNMNVSNDQAASNYIYPQNYYPNSVSNVHVQQGLINPANQYHNTSEAQHSGNLVHHVPQQQLIHPHQQSEQSLLQDNGASLQHYQQQFTHIGTTTNVNHNAHGSSTQFILGMQISSEEPTLVSTSSPPDIATSSTETNISLVSPDNYTESNGEAKKSAAPCSSAYPKMNTNQSTSSPVATNKWNMCSDCGLKFLDLMNLELHVERKHPNLKILGSIVLGEGTVCYKTGVVTSTSSQRPSKDTKITQKHSCVLCNHKTKSLLAMVDHVTSIHFLCGRNMVNSILSVGETAEDPADGKQKAKEGEQGPKSRRLVSKVNTDKDSRVQDKANQCHSCLQSFKTSAEVIRHSIKDRNHTCVVCCFVTCSKHELFEHMKSEHQNWNDFNSFTVEDTNSVKKSVTCFQCRREFKKTSELLDHLESHGTVTAKCEKCGKQDYNLVTVLIHMTTLHPHYMNKLKVTIMMKGKMISGSYLQTISGDLVDWPQVSRNGKTANQVTKEAPSAPEGGVRFVCSACYQCMYSTASLESHMKRHLAGNGSLRVTENTNSGTVGIKRLPNTKCFQCESCGYVSESSAEDVFSHIKNLHLTGNLLHIFSGKSRQCHSITVVTPLEVSK